MLWNFLFCLALLAIYNLLTRWPGGPWYVPMAITLVVAVALGAATEVLRERWRRRGQARTPPA
jgi:hypothetical protein